LALTGFDKVAGVDLRQADIEAVIGPQPCDMTEAGLVVWPGGDSEVVYDLAAEPEIAPQVLEGKPPELPTVPADRLLFRRRPVPWPGWVAAWEKQNESSRPET